MFKFLVYICIHKAIDIIQEYYRERSLTLSSLRDLFRYFPRIFRAQFKDSFQFKDISII